MCSDSQRGIVKTESLRLLGAVGNGFGAFRIATPKKKPARELLTAE
jgi:hypothetical protein